MNKNTRLDIATNSDLKVVRALVETSLVLIIAIVLVAVNSKAEEGRNEFPCGSKPTEKCLPAECVKDPSCPWLSAVTDPAVRRFVTSFSCDGCNTPDYLPSSGIGKCVKYSIEDASESWIFKISGSEKCSFRYGASQRSIIEVSVSKRTRRVEVVKPDRKFILDEQYCETDEDCICLSGSGVIFVGCRNFLYSPSHWSGDYRCEKCECKANKCRYRTTSAE